MVRRFRRARSGGRSSRKTRWNSALWQGIVSLSGDILLANYSYVTFWAKWPADRIRINDDGFVEPSDETVVRQLCRLNVSASPSVAGVLSSPQDIVFGTIAFDGGGQPNDYELATFTAGTPFGPPHPIAEGNDDWMMRIPMNFIFAGNQVPSLEDRFVESKAKRKMPPGTGVLGVLAMGNVLQNDLAVEIDFSIDWRAAIRSGYTR